MASGTIILPIQSAKIAGSFIANPARIDGGSNAWSLLFSATQTESALFQFRMPENYTSAPVAKLQYTMASATSGNVDLEVEVMALTDGESDPDVASFDTVNEIAGGTAVPGTAGILDEISISLANNDTLAANDFVLIRINRDHDDADDTASGDLELRNITIEYTI
jgi:hypothetical protein